MMDFGPIVTSLLLGAFSLFAGAYGVLYGLGRSRGSAALLTAGYLSHGLQWAVGLVVFAYSTLGLGWRLLILVSCLAFLKVPQITWSYLELTHRHAESP
jgi:hypothetical protein